MIVLIRILAIAALLALIVAVVVFVLGNVFTESRADRARREGRLRDALRLYADDDNRKAIVDTLESALPDWPIRALLIVAANELAALKAGATAAEGAGVPDSITNWVAEEAQNAGEALWRTADRIAAVGAQEVDYDTLMPELAREEDEIERLIHTIREARTGLAQLTLAGSRDAEIEVAERRLRALGDTSRELLES